MLAQSKISYRNIHENFFYSHLYSAVVARAREAFRVYIFNDKFYVRTFSKNVGD